MAVHVYLPGSKIGGKAKGIWDSAVSVFGIECVEELWEFGNGEWMLVLWGWHSVSRIVEFAEKVGVSLDGVGVSGVGDGREKLFELRWRE